MITRIFYKDRLVISVVCSVVLVASLFAMQFTKPQSVLADDLGLEEVVIADQIPDGVDFDIVSLDDDSDLSLAIDQDVTVAISDEDLSAIEEIVASEGVDEISILTEEHINEMDAFPTSFLVENEEADSFVYLSIEEDTMATVDSTIINGFVEDEEDPMAVIHIWNVTEDTTNHDAVAETVVTVDEPSVSASITPQYSNDLQISVSTSRRYGPEQQRGTGNGKFIDSVAKGARKTLRFSASSSLSLEAGAVYNAGYAKAGLTQTLSTSYTVTRWGPPNNSWYNSRDFYLKTYMKRVYVTQQVRQNNRVTGTYNSTYIMPTRFTEYSRDYRR